jgi:hypothetical protein
MMLELALIGFNIYTHHTHSACTNNNPGVYVETTGGAVLGVYRNSECHTTAHIGHKLPNLGPIEFHAGIMTGYSRAKLTPYLLPSVALPANFRLTWIPQKRQAFHLSWEHKF